MRVLIVGATGYIGGRLVPRLLDRGHEVVCAARTPAKLAVRPWIGQVETVEADVFDRGSLDRACAGVEAVVYLVHSMDGQGDFLERDRTAAANVRDAAAAAGVERLVYLGGLGQPGDGLSPHLRSRHEVGRLLADGPVTLQAHPENDAALALYESLGFEVVERRSDAYADGDALVLRRG